MHDVEPATLEYDPAVQFVHVVEPGTLENAPAGQMLHTFSLLAASIFEYVPAGQFVHNALPLLFLYDPRTQDVHPPPSGPVYPTLHLQEVIPPEFDIGELLFVGHAEHDFWK